MRRTNLVIFVGSTFRDLEEHRRVVIDALRDVAWLKVMESMGAAPGTTAENCLSWVRASDVYVGILGMRYGSREPASGLSFTELEYDEAVLLGLPRLMYLIDEDRHLLLPNAVDRGREAEDLERFKNKVRSQDLTAIFKSPDHLIWRVHKDLYAYFEREKAWVPEAQSFVPLFDVRDGEAPQPELGPGSDAAKSIATLGTHQSPMHIQLCAWGSWNLDLDRRPLASDREEADVAAAVLVSRFARGDFGDLRQVIALRPEIRNAVRSFLSVRDIDEISLASEIRGARDALYVRHLIDLAGLAASSKCAEAICETVLLHGWEWHRELNARLYPFPMRPFLEVCTDALGRMPPSCESMVEEYVGRARDNKRWHEKRTFEKALHALVAASSARSGSWGSPDPSSVRVP